MAKEELLRTAFDHCLSADLRTDRIARVVGAVGLGESVSIRRVVPDITTDRVDASREFYTGLLGFRVAMDMGWILTLQSRDNPTAQLSLVRGESALSVDERVTLTIEVGDVNAVHAEAVARGHDILYPLTDEPWGVRRFHLRDPNGVIANVMSHLESRKSTPP